MDLDLIGFIKTHKAIAAIGAAGLGGLILYSYLHNKSSSTTTGASTSTTTSPTQYLVPYSGNSGGSPDGGSTGSNSGNGTSGTSPTTTTTTTTPKTTPASSKVPANPTHTAMPVAANQYAVGTQVTGAGSQYGQQSIVQAIEVGQGKFVDLTSEGGLYGSGVNVSGSAFKKGTSGYSEKLVSGNKIDEYRNGKLVGSFGY